MNTAYIAIENPTERARIGDALHRRGWTVIEHATGFHLLSELADVIEGKTERVPGLLVVDAITRGCSGLTIAAGLRDLGVPIPLVVIARPGMHLQETDHGGVRVVTSENALRVIDEIVPTGPPTGSTGLPAHRCSR
jgi:FixJ family two-component response regulator